MRLRRRSTAGAVWLLVAAVGTSAQTISSPSRASGGASAVGHEAVVTATAQGGYDDDLATQLAGPVEGLSISGYTAFGDLDLRYGFTGRSTSFRTELRGYVVSYPASGLRPSLGGEVSLQGGKAIGRTQAYLGGSLRYTPYYSLEAFQGLTTADDVSDVPESSPVNGIPNDRSAIFEGLAGLTRQWSVQHSSTVQFTRVHRDRQGNYGSDLTSSELRAAQSFQATRSLVLSGAYLFSRTDFLALEGSSGAGEMEVQSAEVSASRTIRVSPSRSVILGAGGGVDRVSGTLSTGAGYQYLAPIGRASSQIDIGRRWSVLAEYRRSVVPLDGVSGQSFPSNAFFVNAGGPLVGRLSSAFSAGYAGGRAGADQNSRFHTYNVAAQLDLAISRHLMLNASYNRFEYQIDGQQENTAELPGSLRRGTFRVGLTASAPLTRAGRRNLSGPARR